MPQPVMIELFFLIGVSSCFLIYQGVIIYKYFTQLHNHRKETRQLSGDRKLDTSVAILQCLSTTAIVSFTIVSLYFFILLSLGVDSFHFASNPNLSLNTTPEKQSFYIIFVTVMVVGDIGFTLLRVFHAWRLKMSFDHSIFAISTKLSLFLIIAIIICFLLSCGAILFAFLRRIINPDREIDATDPEFNQTVETAATVFGIAILVQTLLDISICYIFNKNLLSLTVMQRKSMRMQIEIQDRSGNSSPIAKASTVPAHMHSPSEVISKNSVRSAIGDRLQINKQHVQHVQSVEFSQNQQQLLLTTTKQTVLTVASAGVGIIGSVATLSNIGLKYYLFLFIVISAVISATVWLSFAFAKNEYKKQCKKCNDCFFLVCRIVAAHRISRMEQKHMQAIRSIELQTASK